MGAFNHDDAFQKTDEYTSGAKKTNELVLGRCKSGHSRCRCGKKAIHTSTKRERNRKIHTMYKCMHEGVAHYRRRPQLVRPNLLCHIAFRATFGEKRYAVLLSCLGFFNFHFVIINYFISFGISKRIILKDCLWWMHEMPLKNLLKPK